MIKSIKKIFFIKINTYYKRTTATIPTPTQTLTSHHYDYYNYHHHNPLAPPPSVQAAVQVLYTTG